MTLFYSTVYYTILIKYYINIYVYYIAIGQVLAGFLGPSYGWRLPFLLVACPALFFAAILFLTGHEPVLLLTYTITDILTTNLVIYLLLLANLYTTNPTINLCILHTFHIFTTYYIH